MATKAKSSARKKGKRRAGRSTKKKSNIQTMIDNGSLKAENAAKLKPAVRRKIEKLTPSEVRAISKFHLEVCGPAEPDEDGVIY